MSAPDPPRVFGEYHLMGALAHGGMGSIFLARRLGFRPDIQRFCVVKKLPDGKVRPNFLRRFHDEARVVVTLNHRAICHVFDVGLVGDEPYLAMELVEGIDLATLTASLAGTPVDTAVALYILDEVLEALHYAHTHRDPLSGAALQIVHRDVSPQNVMLSFQGAVKLIDFGLVMSSLKTEHTHGGVVVGKVNYMSPEQGRGDAVDARTDVFAAAVILTELLTGRRFYGDLSKDAVSMHVSEGSYPPVLDDAPVALRPALLHALAPERDARTATCDAFQQELAAAFAPRGSARDVRLLIERVLPAERTALEERIRSFHDVALPQSDELTQTLVTHVARSSASDEVAVVPARPAPSVAPESTPGSPARVAVLVGLVAFLATLGVVFGLRGAGVPPVTVQDDLRGAGVPPVTVQELPGLRGAGVPPVTLQELPGLRGAGVPPVTLQELRPAHEGTRAPRPPNVVLPDLAAALDYLTQYCGARAPACRQKLIAQRPRVALLDAAGLRALRADADACVQRCRR